VRRRGRCTASDTAVVAMERGLLVLVVGVVVAQAAHHNHVLSQTFIEEINSANSTWRAGANFHPSTSHNYLRTLMGVHPKAGQGIFSDVMFFRGRKKFSAVGKSSQR